MKNNEKSICEIMWNNVILIIRHNCKILNIKYEKCENDVKTIWKHNVKLKNVKLKKYENNMQINVTLISELQCENDETIM